MLSFFNNSSKIISNIIKTSLPIRTISVSNIRPLKEIKIEKEKDSIIISGITTPAPREDKLLKETCNPKFCPECTLGLDIKHTDVLILSQYVRSDGCMLPRRITGLCRRQHRRIGAMVTMAQKAGLMPNLAPANSKRDPKARYQWRKYNKYYDESTIKC